MATIPLTTPIRSLALSTRTRNAAGFFGEIVTLGDLLKHTRADVKSFPNLGEASLKEIDAFLAKNGLSFKLYNTTTN